jgi:hypothetical protein
VGLWIERQDAKATAYLPVGLLSQNHTDSAAGVAKPAAAEVLKTSAFGRAGSNPATRTTALSRRARAAN